MKRALAVLFISLLAIPCFGGNDAEFHAVVNTIETQYGTHHMHIPFLGFATFCMRVAGVPGTAGLKLAVFDRLPQNDISEEALQHSIEAAIGESWQPLVRVRSKGDKELTIIYAVPSEKEIRVLVVSIEQNDATVVQAKVKASQIRKWIEHPDSAGHWDRD